MNHHPPPPKRHRFLRVSSSRTAHWPHMLPKPTTRFIVWSLDRSLIPPGVSCSNRSRHGGGSSSASSQTVTSLPRTTSPSAKSGPRSSSARSPTDSDQTGALRSMPDTVPSQAPHASLASPHSAQSAISLMDASHSPETMRNCRPLSSYISPEGNPNNQTSAKVVLAIMENDSSSPQTPSSVQTAADKNLALDHHGTQNSYRDLPGFPTTTAPGSTSFVTTAPMPITAPFPMVNGRSGVPCLMTAPAPIYA